MEADEVGRVVGERLHALDGCKQSLSIHDGLIGVVLRDDRVVVGISALDETGLAPAVGANAAGGGVVLSHPHPAGGLEPHSLKQGSRFLGKDECGRLVGLDREQAVAH